MAQADPKFAGQGIQYWGVVTLKVGPPTKFQIVHTQLCLHEMNKVGLLIVQHVGQVLQEPDILSNDVVGSCLCQDLAEHFTGRVGFELEECISDMPILLRFAIQSWFDLLLLHF